MLQGGPPMDPWAQLTRFALSTVYATVGRPTFSPPDTVPVTKNMNTKFTIEGITGALNEQMLNLLGHTLVLEQLCDCKVSQCGNIFDFLSNKNFAKSLGILKLSSFLFTSAYRSLNNETSTWMRIRNLGME